MTVYQARLRPLSRVHDDAWLRMYRADAAAKQNGLCCYCREPLTAATITGDHVHPRIKGGQTTRGNIKAACRDRNRAKGSLSASAFMATIKTVSPDAPLCILLAYMRRRIWLRTHRACERIVRCAQ